MNEKQITEWTNTNLRQVQTCTVPSVVLVAIHVEHFLAFHRQQPREDAFRQTSAQNNDLCAQSEVVGDIDASKGYVIRRTPHPY